MTTITVPKQEYNVLKKKARAYEELSRLFFERIKRDPAEIVDGFKKTQRYSIGFLRDLRTGLENSSLRSGQ